jgi:hypothetical protein
MHILINRKNILTTLFIISYICIIYRTIWWWYNAIALVWSTLIFHIINLFLLILLTIERQELVSRKRFFPIISWILTFLIMIWYSGGLWIGWGMMIRHIAYVLYIWVTYLSITNYRVISLRNISRSWLSIMSMMLSVWYTMIFLSYSKPFDLNCTDLNHQTIGLLTAYLPWNINTQTGWGSTVSHTIETFKNKTLWQVIGVSNWSNTSWSNLTGNHDTGTLLWLVENYKKIFVDDVVSNKTMIDQWVCDFTLNHIKDITQTSTFQISAIILLSLLLSVFMWWLLLVCWILYFLFLLILYQKKVYNINQKKWNYEHIQ